MASASAGRYGRANSEVSAESRPKRVRNQGTPAPGTRSDSPSGPWLVTRSPARSVNPWEQARASSGRPARVAGAGCSALNRWTSAASRACTSAGSSSQGTTGSGTPCGTAVTRSRISALPCGGSVRSQVNVRAVPAEWSAGTSADDVLSGGGSATTAVRECHASLLYVKVTPSECSVQVRMAPGLLNVRCAARSSNWSAKSASAVTASRTVVVSSALAVTRRSSVNVSAVTACSRKTVYAGGASRVPGGVSTAAVPAPPATSTVGEAPSVVSCQRLRWRASRRNSPSGAVPGAPLMSPAGSSTAKVPSWTSSCCAAVFTCALPWVSSASSARPGPPPRPPRPPRPPQTRAGRAPEPPSS